MSDVLTAAREALIRGEDPEKAAFGTSSDSKLETPVTDEPTSSSETSAPEGEAFDPQKWMSEDSGDGADAPAEEPSKNEPSNALDEVFENKDSEEVPSDFEELMVTDHRGRRKVKIDWSDREKLKKLVQRAYGGQKWKVDKEKAESRAKDLSPYKESWDAVETAFKTEGFEGLVKLLSKEDGAYDSYMEKEYQRRRARESASTDELERMDLEDRLTREQRERERVNQELAKVRESSTQTLELSERKELESKIHPAFDRYRFKGKLGDPVIEHQLDSAIWTQALKSLEGLPEETDVTASDADKAFRSVANSFRKIIKNQTEKQVSKTIRKKKKDAQEGAAVKAMSGMKSSGSVNKFKEDMKGGDVVSAMRSFLTGEVKL
jgi:hypothetical protein